MKGINLIIVYTELALKYGWKKEDKMSPRLYCESFLDFLIKELVTIDTEEDVKALGLQVSLQTYLTTHARIIETLAEELKAIDGRDRDPQVIFLYEKTRYSNTLPQ